MLKRAKLSGSCDVENLGSAERKGKCLISVFHWAVPALVWPERPELRSLLWAACSSETSYAESKADKSTCTLLTGSCWGKPQEGMIPVMLWIYSQSAFKGMIFHPGGVAGNQLAHQLGLRHFTLLLADVAHQFFHDWDSGMKWTHERPHALSSEDIFVSPQLSLFKHIREIHVSRLFAGSQQSILRNWSRAVNLQFGKESKCMNPKEDNIRAAA